MCSCRKAKKQQQQKTQQIYLLQFLLHVVLKSLEGHHPFAAPLAFSVEFQLIVEVWAVFAHPGQWPSMWSCFPAKFICLLNLDPFCTVAP